jgi:hypothetical protein
VLLLCNSRDWSSIDHVAEITRWLTPIDDQKTVGAVMKTGWVGAALFGLAMTGEASAWNARGHMMVATVAWDKLDPDTRAKATALIKLNPHYEKWTLNVPTADRDIVAFVKAATWADEIKGEAGYVSSTKDGEPHAKGYADRVRHNEWHYKVYRFHLTVPRRSQRQTQMRLHRSLRSPQSSMTHPRQQKKNPTTWSGSFILSAMFTSRCTPRRGIPLRSLMGIAEAMRSKYVRRPVVPSRPISIRFGTDCLAPGATQWKQ